MSRDEQSTRTRTANLIERRLAAADATEEGRYASVEDGDETVVFDRENPDAWIRSDDARVLR